ncbi:hypothetical protein N7467_006898 [Penicillium canescens]|nr:hypothetical protein N7467_006898 [Penicillium canescens]
MSSQPGDENPGGTRLPTACETCRKLKMRCIRPRNQQKQQENGSTEPCERCRRTNRACKIPKPRPLGRKRGALGRYQGFEKAYLKMQSELKKTKVSHATENVDEIAHFIPWEKPISELLFPSHPSETADPRQSSPVMDNGTLYTPCLSPGYPTVQGEKPRINVVSHAFRSGNIHQTNQEPISNPLALLDNASDATQTLELYPMSHNHLPGLNGGSSATKPQTCQVNGTSLGRQLLHQPGYVSLGLQLDRETLEQGLDVIFVASVLEFRYNGGGLSLVPNVWRNIPYDAQFRIGNILKLFFSLHPVNGILDAVLHTPEFVRSQSALLFAWILALAAQFDHASASIAKRLRLHREKLSKHVHTCGYKIRGDCSRILYIPALGHSGRNIGPGTILALHNPPNWAWIKDPAPNMRNLRTCSMPHVLEHRACPLQNIIYEGPHRVYLSIQQKIRSTLSE